MTTAISTCSWSTRRAPPKTSSCASRRSTGDRTRPTCISCRRCGSATTGRSGLPNRTELPRNRTSSRSRHRQVRRRSRRRIPCWGRSSFHAKATCRCSSPKTKPTTPGCSGLQNESPYVKDGINECVVHGRQDAVNPEQHGTKVAAHYQVTIGAGQTTRDSPAARQQFPGPEGPTLWQAVRPTSSPTGFVKPMSSTRRSRRRP